MSDDFSLNRLINTRYRPTREAEEFLEQLRRSLVPGEKYRVARLAIARSLVEPGEVASVQKGTEFGTAIPGTALFGEDFSVWACLVAHANPPSSAEVFRQLVEAHWDRGAKLLQEDFDATGKRDVDFAVKLAELAGSSTGSGGIGLGGMAASSVRLSVRFGEVGIEQKTNAPLDIQINAPGVSPHLAIMGKTRSGKTRTGLSIAERIARDVGTLPILFIDPKGEFVKDGAFVQKTEGGTGWTIADKFPGMEPIDVPRAPVPLDFLSLPANSADPVVAQAAISFRDSFKHCIRTRGDVAMDNMREVVEDLIRQRRGPVSLERIRDTVHEANTRAGRKKDTVEAKLNELSSLRLFEPTMPPEVFFRRRWIIGLGGAPEESKRLVMFLVLDALANHLLSQADAPTDAFGYRGVRQLVIVDEAKEILEYRHAALSNLVRKSAAKGGIVMLLSQSPEDFDSEQDDFLAQMGTIGVFASNAQTLRSLRTALGQRVTPELFSDRDLQRGVALVKASGRDLMRVLAWK